MPQCAREVIPISQGLWQAEYRVEDYSQALRFDVCLVGFGLAWALPPPSFPFLHLGLGELTLLPVLPLYFGST